MPQRTISAISASLVLAAVTFSGTTFVYAQQAPSSTIHVTSRERLETETWWPTMSTAPLQAYAGSQACTACHQGQVSETKTAMQRAATRPADDHLLSRAIPAFHAGAHAYSVTENTGALQLSDTIGGHKASQSLDWAFGAGDLARTFLYRTNGRWYQSEVSLYTKPAALDITTGFGANTSGSPVSALGNILSQDEANSCFGCHTVHAVTSSGLDPLHAEPGIGCEACHGPGKQHIQIVNNRKADHPLRNMTDAAIFHPGKLSPADSIDFCGSCHRSFADATLSTGPQADRAVVRFQPYRLEESKCWIRTQDERLTCIACHDPHQPLNRDTASYDKNCLQCHAASLARTSAAHATRVCPKASHDCVTCHMPKVELPTMHGSFTDHFIRVVAVGEPFPR